MESIYNKEKELNSYFNEELKKIKNVKIYGLPDINLRVGITSIIIDGYSSGEISDYLNEKYEIITRSGGHCAPLLHKAMGTVDSGLVRFSFSHNNTIVEVETALEAIRNI